MVNYAERAEEYRAKAEQARMTADEMRHPDARDCMQVIARDYDLIAEIMEQLSEGDRPERN